MYSLTVLLLMELSHVAVSLMHRFDPLDVFQKRILNIIGANEKDSDKILDIRLLFAVKSNIPIL